MKVFLVTIAGIGSGFFKNETSSKARYQAFRSAKFCGYRVRLIDIHVKRAKQYDAYNLPKYGIAIEFIEYYKPEINNG